MDGNRGRCAVRGPATTLDRAVDSALSVGVLVALTVNPLLGWWWADPLAACGLGLYAAYGIVGRSSRKDARLGGPGRRPEAGSAGRGRRHPDYDALSLTGRRANCAQTTYRGATVGGRDRSSSPGPGTGATGAVVYGAGASTRRVRRSSN